jgi:adenosylhomocysteine nucleosidase
MPRVGIVAALEREVSGLIKSFDRVEAEYQGRKFSFLEGSETVVVCGGIGVEAARRAAEALIALYRPGLLVSAGFAGALNRDLHVGDIFLPSEIVDARDGSRIQVEGGCGVLLTFIDVAGASQKQSLAHAYGAQAVDMEAAAVGAVAGTRGIMFRAIKVISDEWDFEMPDMARFIDAQGRFRTADFTLFVMVRPWLWVRIVKLAGNSGNAARVLSQHLKALNPSASHLPEAKTI